MLTRHGHHLGYIYVLNITAVNSAASFFFLKSCIYSINFNINKTALCHSSITVSFYKKMKFSEHPFQGPSTLVVFYLWQHLAWIHSHLHKGFDYECQTRHVGPCYFL